MAKIVIGGIVFFISLIYSVFPESSLLVLTYDTTFITTVLGLISIAFGADEISKDFKKKK